MHVWVQSGRQPRLAYLGINNSVAMRANVLVWIPKNGMITFAEEGTANTAMRLQMRISILIVYIFFPPIYYC